MERSFCCNLERHENLERKRLWKEDAKQKRKGKRRRWSKDIKENTNMDLATASTFAQEIDVAVWKATSQARDATR